MTEFDDASNGTTSCAADTSNYPQVRFKELEGSLVLTREQIAFSTTTTSSSIQPSWSIAWLQVLKHQVSPVTYPKCLLKLVLKEKGNVTFQLANRAELERIRRDITGRLQYARTAQNGSSAENNENVTNNHVAGPSRKRPHSQTISANIPGFGDLDATALAVTRSSLLAANPTLRAQHRYLVEETETVSEDDFWETHQDLLEEEFARIAGTLKPGMSSLLQSHLPLQGRVTLGVEEMRQIFILYPAVHKAYEEQVPFKLSDEQFWRNYLASQFVHRDRGRIGTAARHHASSSSQEANDKKDKAAKSGGNTLSVEEQEARAAAIGTDDLFSRYDQKLREASGESAGMTTAPPTTSNSVRGNRLAVGQFDLVSTMSSERGELLQGPRDYHPPNPILNDDDEGKGSRVIRKYNRHWAMVLHPDEAVAGSNLMEVARLSVLEDADNDVEEAKPGGGVHEEMQRLVDLVVASEEGGDDEEEEFTLKNVEAYYTGRMLEKKDAQVDSEEARQRYAVFSQRIAAKVRDLAAPLRTPGTNPNNTAFSHDECFPTPVLGRELLSALTKKMSQDSKTEAETQDVVNSLPEEFLKRLQSYFRRSSELLRHFFGLRQLPEHANSEKMARIVQGMETVYKEVDGMRKELPQSELGEVMRKMCFPIMVQLDWAFKLRREGSGVSTGRSGGFVTVEELY